MILVVGGHSRNIGKTSVVVNLIRSIPQHSWTAIKITQFGHGVCSSNGEDCDCSAGMDHPFALTREKDATAGTDSSRYLAAGALESWWLRTRTGELGFAIPALRRLTERANAMGSGVLIESNSVMQFLRPDVYAVVLDPGNADFKASNLLYLDRADAFLLSGEGPLGWTAVAPRLFAGKPVFRLADHFEPPPDFLHFLESQGKVLAALRR